MSKNPIARKAVAVLLSVTMLLSCMVWSGVSAAATVYTTDFTGYTLTNTGNMHDVAGNGSAIAQVVDTGNAAHGQAMQLTYTDGSSACTEIGFRFFANNGAGNANKVAVAEDVAVKVDFSYKVEKLGAAAELRALSGSVSWQGPNINSGQAAGADHWGTAATLSATATAGEWKTASVVINAERANSGVHIYLHTADPAAQNGASVLIDDVQVTVGYEAPVTPPPVVNRPTGTEYKTDFTNYGVTGVNDLSSTTSTKARVITADAAHGSAMELSFLSDAGMKQAGFRFFANTGTATADKVAFAQGTTAMVKLSYKVQSLASAAQLRVIAGSWPWTAGVNENTGTFNVPSEHCAVAAELPATATAGEWKTVTVLVKGACANAGIHIYLDSATPAVGDAILVDDVQVNVGYVPATLTLDYNDGVKKETLSGVDGTPVVLPTPTRAAHIFKGWNTKADGSGTAVSNLVYGNDVHGKTYYAIWDVDPNAASIRFETNGGDAVAPIVGERGAQAAVLPTPTKGLYTFAGWYTDAALTVKAENVTFPTTAGGSLTLYAKWNDPAPLAAPTAPGGKLLGTQTFETDSIADIDLQKFNSITADASYQGSKSLKTTVIAGFNSQRGRPRIVIKDEGGSNVKVEAGKTYVVSFWVRSALTNGTFTFYAATMGASDVDAMIVKTNSTGGDCHKLQTITATVGKATAPLNSAKTEANNCSLAADQWTQVVITIPSLVLDDANDDNYLSIGCTYGAAGSTFNCDMYIDNIQLFECRPVTVSFDTNGGDAIAPISSETGSVVLPEPYKFGYTYIGWYTDPSCDAQYKVTSPYSPLNDTQTLYTKWEKSAPASSTQVQDFEGATSVDEFAINTKKPFVLATDQSAGNGTNALKVSLKKGYNGNFDRPIWALQMNGQSAPMQVIPGTSATVTFKVMTTRDTPSIGYMLDTVNSLTALDASPASSAAANAYRTMQVLSTTSHGTLNAAKNEVQNVSLTAGQWTEITATIPTIVAHGGGNQYLVLAITDTKSTPGNTAWVDYDLYIDDVTVTAYTGGHATNVTYNTMGGDPVDPGTGIVWTDITVQATRAGYEFDGWYAEEACQTRVTEYPCVENVTLYAGWRPAGAEVMNFEIDSNFVPRVYAHTDLSQTAVQTYYTSTGGGNNWYTGNTAYHSLEEKDGLKAMKVVYGAGANATTQLYGFRLVKADGSAFATTPGETYQVSFKYYAEALPKDAYATIIEASIPWKTMAINSALGYTEFDGTLIKTTDVGGGWKEATVNFVSKNANGIHLSLRSTDMSAQEGTEIYFADIKVQSYQVTEFITTPGAVRVENEQNATPDGKAALKIDATTTGRVVYSSGLGGKLFSTNTINDAIAWLYSDTDTTVTLTAYSDPSLDDMSATHVMGEQTVALTGGVWSRVAMSFGLTPVAGESVSYISMGVSGTGTVYVDDVSIGTYINDNSKVQGYEEFDAKVYPNTSRLDGTIHGLNGNTVVAGTGYNSNQSLQITMNTDKEQDVARTVLIRDKMDATGTVGSGYIVTFQAMAKEDVDVTFAIGTTGKIDVSERDMYATTAEAGATSTVSLTANQWVSVAVVVSDLQGKNPELTVNPYVTLAAWFEGAADDNQKAVYIDDVLMKNYVQPSVTREDVLCFENTDAFGFGKDMNLSTVGTMQVSLDQNHTAAGYYSLKVNTTVNAGGARPQFNLVNANAKAVKVEKGKTYRVSFWAYMDAAQQSDKFRYWLAVTDSEDAYTTSPAKDADVVHEPTEGVTLTKGTWQQISVTLEDLAKAGYLRLGIAAFTVGTDTTVYLDDIRVVEYKAFDPTGNETVWHFENHNPGDNSFIRNGNGGISDEINHTDKGLQSLKLTGKSWAGTDRNQFIVINPATNQPYEFNKGDSYTFHFWMYYSSTTGLADFELNTWILGVDDPTKALTNKNAWNNKMEWDGTINPITNDGVLIPDEWNEFEVTITATNGKYMLIGMTNSTIMTGGYDYFIDDFEIRKPTPAVVTLDANGGAFDETDAAFLNDKGQYIVRTAVGLYITGPSIDPYLSGKRFMGWALDPEGQEFYDILTTPIDKTELTLYAMWGDWDTGNDYDKIDKDNLSGEKDEIKYKTEIHSEKVWTGNAQIPVLDFDDNFALDDADPVTYTPPVDDADGNDGSNGLPAWLIIVIIVAAVMVVGGGAALALLLLKGKKSKEEKEGNA